MVLHTCYTNVPPIWFMLSLNYLCNDNVSQSLNCLLSFTACMNAYVYNVDCLKVMICSCAKRYAVALISPYAQ